MLISCKESPLKQVCRRTPPGDLEEISLDISNTIYITNREERLDPGMWGEDGVDGLAREAGSDPRDWRCCAHGAKAYKRSDPSSVEVDSMELRQLVLEGESTSPIAARMVPLATPNL